MEIYFYKTKCDIKLNENFLYFTSNMKGFNANNQCVMGIYESKVCAYKFMFEALE